MKWKKNANNKVNRWSLELTTYNIMFEWISGAKNKAANCLSWLVEQLPKYQLLLTCSQLHTLMNLLQVPEYAQKELCWHYLYTPHPDVTPNVSPDTNQTPKSRMADRL